MTVGQKKEFWGSRRRAVGGKTDEAEDDEEGSGEEGEEEDEEMEDVKEVDERHSRLLVRFRCASLQAERSIGVIGQAEVVKSTAANLTEATKCLFRDILR